MEYFADALRQYSCYEYLWFFMVYAVGGWCLEVAYHVVTMGHFVNRGFLNGPVCPIYGFGMLTVIICLLPLKENKLILFAGSVILTTLIELVTGFVLEKLFHQRWWDYSEEPFNFHGYICLKFSLEWGIGCLLAVDVLHTVVSGLIVHFPKLPGMILLGVLFGIFAVDCVITVFTVIGLNRRLQRMNELAERISGISEKLGDEITSATLQGMERHEQLREGLAEKKEQLEERSDEIRTELQEMRQSRELQLMNQYRQREKEMEELREKLEKLRGPRKRGHRRLIRAFPHMRSTKFSDELKNLQETVRNLKL